MNLKIETTPFIPKAYRNTPIENLIRYHNYNEPFQTYENAELLIGTCMDNRVCLKIPERFAYVIRNAGSNLKKCDFMISYALSVGQIKHFAVIGHSDCGMVNLEGKKDDFINGIQLYAGWNKERAITHFNEMSPVHEIRNVIDFTLKQVEELQLKYPKTQIIPLIYMVEDNKLYFI